MPNDIPDEVTHYTNADGLRGIVEGGCLWATSPSHLNDRQELRHGVDVLARAWRAIRPEELDARHDKLDESLRDLVEVVSGLIFVFSASAAQDSVAQWQTYAGLGGYSLQLDTTTELINADIGPDHPTEAVGNYLPPRGWYRVIYDPSDQEAVAEDALRAAVDLPTNVGRLIRWTAMQQILATAAIRMKHVSFAAEEEVRFVVPRPLAQGFEPLERSGAFGPRTPYVRLHSQDPSHPLPINSVMTAPTGKTDVDSHAVRKAADILEFRYPQVPVVTSSSPFRTP